VGSPTLAAEIVKALGLPSQASSDAKAGAASVSRPLALPPACARAVELIGQGECFRAHAVLAPHVASDESCSLVADVCLLHLGETVASIAPPVPTVESAPVTTIVEPERAVAPGGSASAPACVSVSTCLRHLARALQLATQTAADSGGSCLDVECQALGHLLAFLAHRLTEQCAPLEALARARASELGNRGALLPGRFAKEGASALEEDTSPSGAKSRADGIAARSADLESLREILRLTGISAVKDHFFRKRDRARLAKQRGEDLSSTSHHVIFVGNPGTGKTTVARLYAKLLKETGVLPSASVEETSGAKLADGGALLLRSHLEKLEGGGVLFVDEAYQLIPDTSTKGVRSLGMGAQVLDTLLTEMENRRGKLVVIFAGYAERMAKLLEYNEGLPSRFPDTFLFADFENDELLSVLDAHVASSKFRLSGHKHARIAVRRLGLQRGTAGFGNARAVRNLWERTLARQAERIVAERRGASITAAQIVSTPSDFEIQRNDLLGARGLDYAQIAPLRELEGMVGIQSVKWSVRNLLALLETNVEREEAELPVQQVTLNRVFLGNPGTGKTTVAKIFGAILQVCDYVALHRAALA
jgi:Holliday junction resolvasome RuvABC ATP-dependent DNA helicase subunit